MNPTDQIPAIDQERTRLTNRINRASARIIDCETAIAHYEQRRLNLVNYLPETVELEAG